MASGDEIHIRAGVADDGAGFVRAVEGAFGGVVTEEDVEYWTAGVPWERFLVAVDGGQVVGGAGADLMEMTLPVAPGRPPVAEPVAAVTAVGVSATHRRRGIQRRMMTRLHDDARERGEAIAALTASESLIYRRYGYGLATSYQQVALLTDHAAFVDPPASSGRFRLVDADEAAKVVPGVHDQCRRLRPGDLNRPADYWDRYFKDRPQDRDGATARFYAVHESARGEPDGYASYRVQRRAVSEQQPGYRVEAIDVYGRDDAVQAQLWQFLFDLDLMAEVVIQTLPLDSALRWRLADPRRLRTLQLGDHVWVRLLDVCAALGARGYRTEGRLVFEVRDGDAETDGRYVLEAGPDGGACRRARRGEAVELALPLPDLGSAYLGGTSWWTLAATGRLEERVPGAVARADELFRSHIAPWCGTDF